jgi:hypothetical protein
MAKSNSNKLNVLLYDNPLTPEKDDYIGRVQLNGTITNADVARDIVNQRSEYRYETILNILTLGDDAKRNRLASGYAVNDGVAQMYPSITGRFVGSGAQFDSKIHSIGVTMTTTSALRNALENTTVAVQGAAVTGPVINRIIDVYSETENTQITTGRNLKIVGQRLRIAGEDSSVVGVWFVRADDASQRTRVDDRDMVDNNPSQLTVLAPDLTAGDYYVEVVTQSMTGGKELLKEPRAYRFEIALTVE